MAGQPPTLGFFERKVLTWFLRRFYSAEQTARILAQIDAVIATGAG